MDKKEKKHCTYGNFMSPWLDPLKKKKKKKPTAKNTMLIRYSFIIKEEEMEVLGGLSAEQNWGGCQGPQAVGFCHSCCSCAA